MKKPKISLLDKLANIEHLGLYITVHILSYMILIALPFIKVPVPVELSLLFVAFILQLFASYINRSTYKFFNSWSPCKLLFLIGIGIISLVWKSLAPNPVLASLASGVYLIFKYICAYFSILSIFGSLYIKIQGNKM